MSEENVTKLAVKAETALTNLRKRAKAAQVNLREKWEAKEQAFLEKQPRAVVDILRLTGKLGQATVMGEAYVEFHEPEKQPSFPGTEEPAPETQAAQ